MLRHPVVKIPHESATWQVDRWHLACIWDADVIQIKLRIISRLRIKHAGPQTPHTYAPPPFIQILDPALVVCL